MGIVTGLLLAPVTAPVRAFRFFLERLRDEAEAVLRDEGRAFAELIDLSMRHSAGQVSDAEYEAQEEELLERLSSIRDYRDELLYAQGEADDEDTWPYADGEPDAYAGAYDEAYDGASAGAYDEAYADAYDSADDEAYDGACNQPYDQAHDSAYGDAHDGGHPLAMTPVRHGWPLHPDGEQEDR